MMIKWRAQPTMVIDRNLAAIIITNDEARRQKLRDALSPLSHHHLGEVLRAAYQVDARLTARAAVACAAAAVSALSIAARIAAAPSGIAPN
jgi:hypothetical protein